MTREETTEVLTMLKVAFPASYSNMSRGEMIATVNLWSEMFAVDDVNVVKYALHKIIGKAKFPPTIGEIKEVMRELMQTATNEATDEELWHMLKDTLKDGIWGAQAAFDRFPPILRRYCGTAATIRDLAVMDTETLNSVVHGQFLKQIKIIRNREENLRDMPDEVRSLMGASYIPLAQAPALTEAEWNDRRNALLDQLEGGTA